MTPILIRFLFVQDLSVNPLAPAMEALKKKMVDDMLKKANQQMDDFIVARQEAYENEVRELNRKYARQSRLLQSRKYYQRSYDRR